jgi:hypothetical protein
MDFIIPALIISFVGVAVVTLNLWDRRETAKLSQQEREELEEEIRQEKSIW